jgi:hypothetical protein
MRAKFTLLLLVLNAGLLFFIFYLEKDLDAERRFQEQRRLALGAEAVDLDYLAITTGSAASGFILEKPTEGWMIAHPLNWPANPFAVERILSQLQFLEHDTSFPVSGLAAGGQSLADYGLEPAELTLVFGRRGERREVRVGRPTDIGSRLYMLSPDGQRIHVVNRSLLESLSMPLEDLRSSEVFTIPVFEARSWTLQLRDSANLRLRLERRDREWVFNTPIQTRADRAEVETMLSRLVALRALTFLPETIDLNLIGLANPALRVTIDGNGRRETLLLGSPTNGGRELFAKLESRPTIFTVEAPFAESLLQAQTRLRERRLLSLEGDTVHSIALEPVGQDGITLQALEGRERQWQVVARGDNATLRTLPGDADGIHGLANRLTGLRALADGGFVTDAPSAADLERFGLAAPTWRVRLTAQPASNGRDPAANISETLLLGVRDAANPRMLYARLAESPSVFAVDADILEALRSDPVFYRDRQLQSLPQGARVTRLSVTRLSDSRKLLDAVNHGNGSWDESLAALPVAVREAAAGLVTQVRELRARRFHASSFSPRTEILGEERPWAYLLEAEISLDGGVSPQVMPFQLYLSDPTGGPTLLAGSSELGLVFQPSTEFVDAFTVIGLDRAIDQAPAPEMSAATPDAQAEPAP